MIRKKTVAALCAVALMATSCLGPDNARNSLRNWNAEVTDKDWANEAIFLGLTIIPVYFVVTLADILVFNTVQYWGDSNPISDPGPFPSSFGN